jgi:hypothetical protein
MFGYVRPLKPELLVREYTRYRSIYCGLCKQIGRDYGQLPRLTLGYELTLLAALLLSLSEEERPVDHAGCILNPVLKKPIVRGGAVLELCAGLSVMLAWHKADDNVRDEQALAARLARSALTPAKRKAQKRFPEYGRIIEDGMASLIEIEQAAPEQAAAAAEPFAAMLRQIFDKAAGLVSEQPEIIEAVGLFGYNLGTWIYLLDAIDDLASDCNNGSWNPFSRLEPDKARLEADGILADQEQSMDRTAALLPYRRDGGLLANVVTKGLPDVRRQILSGEELPRL